MIHILGEQNSIFTQFLAEMRDANIQKDSLRFRRNLERVGEIFAYEISKTLQFDEKEICTPLGNAKAKLLSEEIVLATILRAGLPLHQGLLNYFDKAQNAFIGSYRKYDQEDFEVLVEYLSSPEIDDKVVVLSDPMLATGSSMVLAYKALLERGKPKHVHIVSLVGCNEGLEYVKKRLPSKNVTYWFGAIDEELTVKAYIVPGLGDAGDLAFGSK